MSKPRYDWWPYVKGIIRRYPELREEYAELHSVSAVANYSGMPAAHGGGRSTEMVALRELPSTRQREYEAVRRALETTGRYRNGKARLRMVSMVFWSGNERVTLATAALRLHYSKDRVTQWHTEFIRLVAANFGLMDED